MELEVFGNEPLYFCILIIIVVAVVGLVFCGSVVGAGVPVDDSGG